MNDLTNTYAIDHESIITGIFREQGIDAKIKYDEYFLNVTFVHDIPVESDFLDGYSRAYQALQRAGISTRSINVEVDGTTWALMPPARRKVEPSPEEQLAAVHTAGETSGKPIILKPGLEYFPGRKLRITLYCIFAALGAIISSLVWSMF